MVHRQSPLAISVACKSHLEDVIFLFKHWEQYHFFLNLLHGPNLQTHALSLTVNTPTLKITREYRELGGNAHHFDCTPEHETSTPLNQQHSWQPSKICITGAESMEVGLCSKKQSKMLGNACPHGGMLSNLKQTVVAWYYICNLFSKNGCPNETHQNKPYSDRCVIWLQIISSSYILDLLCLT